MSTHSALDRLLEKIRSGHTDPQAILIYGSDSYRIESAARQLIGHWLYGDMDREVDFARTVDAQQISPWSAGMQIRHTAINPDSSEQEGKFEGVPVRDFFRTRPLMAPRKVVWFRQADRLNRNASNAFLKLMEELPDYARVVLTTRQISRIFPTIRSRALCVAAPISDFEPGHEPAEGMESIWAQNPGELSFIRAHHDIHQELWNTLEQIPSAPPVAALAFAEKTRKSAQALADQSEWAARDAQVYFVELISRWWLDRYPTDPEVATQAADLCRMIGSYANAAIGLDALFGSMLVRDRSIADRVLQY